MYLSVYQRPRIGIQTEMDNALLMRPHGYVQQPTRNFLPCHENGVWEAYQKAGCQRRFLQFRGRGFWFCRRLLSIDGEPLSIAWGLRGVVWTWKRAEGENIVNKANMCFHCLGIMLYCSRISPSYVT